ncbi:hypothetical protein [Desulfosporosinus metallidurans]|uniref:hypothetical protein n=1 Tax=Desulfosporosinus metallidurans TaxID=1888891 RepID=UPI00094C190F|nr:hypothetical protein [Desulfosporosinus metallidurans]
MTERLNNTEISQRIMDANSDLQRYLNLAPSFKPNPAHPKTVNEYPQPPISTARFLRPKLKP